MEQEEEEISTEEILASIRSILLEKQEQDADEPVFELTKAMIYRPAFEPDFNKATDKMIDDYAAFFKQKL
ncbi:MAG: hypothetical protein J6X42_04455 [Alphaproteobacteria bacterium]|nr:hypothetical protein [Alphaproteobacteria bacterium]